MLEQSVNVTDGTTKLIAELGSTFQQMAKILVAGTFFAASILLLGTVLER